MRHYQFVLHNGDGIDELGSMTLADDGAAVAFGMGVLRDVTHGEADQLLNWPIKVSEGERVVGTVVIPSPLS